MTQTRKKTSSGRSAQKVQIPRELKNIVARAVEILYNIAEELTGGDCRRGMFGDIYN